VTDPPLGRSISSDDAAGSLLSDDNLLLVELVLDQLTVTDSLSAYDSPSGLLIPVGELARLLDIDLTIDIGQRRVIGTIGQARRPLLVDDSTHIVRLASASEPLSPGDMVVGATEIYVRASLLEKMLPVKVKYDGPSLRLSLAALEPLPIQSRLDRLRQLRGLREGGGSNNIVYKVRSSAKLFSLPSFDVSAELGGQKRTPSLPYRYDIRAGGDLLFSNFQGYVGSDDAGRPVNARMLLERRDADGHALGPFGLTRFSAGDIFTPALSIGPRSVGGRGISFSTAPLTQQSVFGRIDLRGELPLGYDVELYVNDVLRSGQSTPVQGRYEFRDVPLVRGINVIRIVSYGPRGERTEEVRVVNVGGGQLEKGQLVVNFGAVQQEKPLLNLSNSDSDAVTGPGSGHLRVALDVLYGLSETVTIAGGAATYSPTNDRQRYIVTAGVRTSIRGIATQFDATRDDTGGIGVAVALAAEAGGVSGVARHAEYRAGFLDETTPRGDSSRPLRRSTGLDLNWQLKPLNSLTIPISVRATRDQYANGDIAWSGIFRASAAVGGIYLSSGLDLDRLESGNVAPSTRLSGILTASSFALFQWQLRANLDYFVLPKSQLRAISVTADRALSERTALRVGLGHGFTGEKESTVQITATRRFGFADMSLSGQYSAPRNDWRVALQLAFSLVRDPLGGGYSPRRPGAASGGSLALQAFLDRNGNGRFDGGEQPVPGVLVDTPTGKQVATDERGRVLVTGLGYASAAQVRTNLDNVALDNVSGPPPVIEFTPRAGTVEVVSYPLQARGEVMLSIMVRRGAKMVGLSAVRLKAIGDSGEEREGRTEYDGSVVFDGLRPGAYRIELVAEQAERLHMRLEAPIAFTIGGEGGAAPDLQGVVVFDNAQ